MRVAVIGVGYVGLVQAAVLADVGNRVTCVDINQARIDNLRQGIVGIYEPDLDALVRKNVADQHLPGSGLRREITPVLLLLRPQRALVADVVRAGGDSPVLRTVCAALPATRQPAAEHRDRFGPLGFGNTHLDVDDGRR